MSALGHKQTFRSAIVMSALPPKADIRRHDAANLHRADALLLPKTDRLNCEHDLAGRSGLKDLLVRARCLGEWQFFANNGPQSAVFEACKEPGVDVRLFLRCNGPERERANRSAAPHQLTRIDGDLAATADHDDAAIIGQ